MATNLIKGEGGEPPGPSAVIAKLGRQRLVAIATMRRRRRVLAPIGAAAQQPIQQFTVPRVGMSHDPWKTSVRCASTANVAIATALEAGDSIDGVTLAAGDRVLLKNQSDAKQNGIYVAVQNGAASRADDGADGSHYLHAVVGVQQGTLNANHFFVCFTDAPIVIGSTNMTWTDMGALMGLLDGTQIQDGTVDLVKLLNGGTYDRGSIIFSDGSTWVHLGPPSVKSKLTHDGSGDPYWEPV